MTTYPKRHLTTGGDPRTLADYAKLREEMHKLSHPARPDVDWLYAERLCLSLFDRNGVELQTAAWYTLARTQLTGLSGLNEGLAILETLITRQWGSLWPQLVHARMEILCGLGKRLQQRAGARAGANHQATARQRFIEGIDDLRVANDVAGARGQRNGLGIRLHQRIDQPQVG